MDLVWHYFMVLMYFAIPQCSAQVDIPRLVQPTKGTYNSQYGNHMPSRAMLPSILMKYFVEILQILSCVKQIGSIFCFSIKYFNKIFQ